MSHARSKYDHRFKSLVPLTYHICNVAFVPRTKIPFSFSNVTVPIVHLYGMKFHIRHTIRRRVSLTSMLFRVYWSLLFGFIYPKVPFVVLLSFRGVLFTVLLSIRNWLDAVYLFYLLEFHSRPPSSNKFVCMKFTTYKLNWRSVGR